MPTTDGSVKPAARRLLGGLDANPPITEVLQPRFMGFDALFPVALFGAVLVASAPRRPGHDLRGIGRPDPDQMPEQTPHLGDGEWQQIPGALGGVLSPRQPLGGLW